MCTETDTMAEVHCTHRADFYGKWLLYVYETQHTNLPPYWYMYSHVHMPCLVGPQKITIFFNGPNLNIQLVM